jgi:hypothetical protein
MVLPLSVRVSSFREAESLFGFLLHCQARTAGCPSARQHFSAIPRRAPGQKPVLASTPTPFELSEHFPGILRGNWLRSTSFTAFS